MLPLSKRASLDRLIKAYDARKRMNVSNNGLAFLLDWEGFRPYLYDDGGRRGLGNATVGIGILVHLGPYHDRGQCAACDKWPRDTEPKNTWLTPQQGMILLSDKANATGVFVGGQNYVGAVRTGFPSGINQNQFDAMVSYAYNYGSGAVLRMAKAFYSGSDMYRAFTDERYLLPLWAREGLLRRRKAEYALWSKPDDGSATFPQPDEEDEMKPVRIWCAERSKTYLLGPWGATAIDNPADDKTLEKLYGPHAAVLTGATLDAIK